MRFPLSKVFRRARTLANPPRRASRKFQPVVDGVERLESRALMHSGAVAAVAHANAPPAAFPIAQLQAAVAVSYMNTGPGPFEVQTQDAAILIPSGLQPGHTYPLIVAFAFNGNPIIPFQVWWKQAQANHWIVYASKDFHNAVSRSGLASSEKVASEVMAQLNTLSSILPIDTSRIIFTGMSGAANYADFMNLLYPGYAAGIIINSGRVPNQLFSNHPTRGHLTYPTASAYAGSRRVGVFLASPSDSQFFPTTGANAKMMQRLGWDTLFLSFAGGHWNAPPPTYDKAIAWILSQPSWTAPNA